MCETPISLINGKKHTQKNSHVLAQTRAYKTSWSTEAYSSYVWPCGLTRHEINEYCCISIPVLPLVDIDSSA